MTTHDRDKVIKAPGVSQTEVIRDTMLFVADSIEDVWEHIDWIRADPERELIAISEAAPAVTVLADTEPK